MKVRKQVPVSEKIMLNLEEAVAYSGLGINKLRKISDSDYKQQTLTLTDRRIYERGSYE